MRWGNPLRLEIIILAQMLSYYSIARTLTAQTRCTGSYQLSKRGSQRRTSLGMLCSEAGNAGAQTVPATGGRRGAHHSFGPCLSPRVIFAA
jgi:hypothetical protein